MERKKIWPKKEIKLYRGRKKKENTYGKERRRKKNSRKKIHKKES